MQVIKFSTLVRTKDVQRHFQHQEASKDEVLSDYGVPIDGSVDLQVREQSRRRVVPQMEMLLLTPAVVRNTQLEAIHQQLLQVTYILQISKHFFLYNNVFPEKESLLSRIFRRSKRSHCRIKTFSAQFPPAEWFNSRAIHLHSVGTQTTMGDNKVIFIVIY